MKISIAMATYNGAPYLREQLESFIGQTRLPDELIVCDDVSTDDTLIILEEFKKNAPFDVHIHSKQTESRTMPKTLVRHYLFAPEISCSYQTKTMSGLKTKLPLSEMAEKDSRNEVFMNDAELTHEDLTPTGMTMLTQYRSRG